MKRAIVVALILSTFVPVSSLHANVVNMPDPNLRAAVRAELNLPVGEPITDENISRLTELRVVGTDMMELTGLEHATNLRKIHFGNNLLSDISVLGALTNLESINLRDNQISDIAALGHLTQLTYLKLRNNRIVDVSPLSNLTRLSYLNVATNQVNDVRPLAHLTSLRWLDLGDNVILDLSPLDGLTLDEFIHDTIGCDMPPLPLAPRIEERTFPSIFTAWSDKETWPSFDLIFCCPRFDDTRIVETDTGFEFRTRGNTSWAEPIGVRDAYLADNPTMVFLHGLAVIWGNTETIPADSPWWQRDENGNIRMRSGSSTRGLMELSHPGWQERMIEIAATIDRCGLYDGIFIDGWGDGDYPGQTAILRGIRERVRDEFLIMVNTNDRQAPDSAPYINGVFMETGFPEKRDTPEGIERGLVKVENTLRWAASSLQEPRIIGLEGSDYRHESPFTPRNVRWMRATTTLGLTFSDGYVAFPLRGGPFYEFWNADLGRPVGEKNTLYDEEIPGLYIREYTNGWAVYNHSGEARVVTLPEEARSAAHGWENTTHPVPDLDGDILLRVSLALDGDVNGDGVVNILDLTLVAQAMGTDDLQSDVNGDGVINVFDLVFVANQF